MSLVRTWWAWCSESLAHTFAGVTAPLLLIAGFAVIVFYASQGGDGSTPLPPRSDIAGVCVTAPAGNIEGCATTSPTGMVVTTPTAVPPTPTPAPRSYTVQAGDTLSRICASEAPNLSLDACMDAIVKLSQLDGPDEIFEGQSLKLPPASSSSSSSSSSSGRSSGGSSSSGGAVATSTPVIETAPEPTVAVADEPEPTPNASLTAIGPDVADEEEPTVEPEPTEEPDPEFEEPSEEEIAASGGTEYVVEDGDSLIGICASMVPDMSDGDCVEFVVILNGLAGPEAIQAGQTIFLP